LQQKVPNMHKHAIILGVILLSLPACATLRQSRQGRFITRSIERTAVFDRSFTGFYLADAETGRTLCAFNADKLFTPASNAKILTLAVCLEVLSDSLPRWRYQPGEPAVFTGTGDPTTLHPAFAAWQALPPALSDTARARPHLRCLPGAAELPRMPAGWMWDDMPYPFSAEISALPIYGNTLEVRWNGQSWEALPAFFQPYVKEIPAGGQAIKRIALGGDILAPDSAAYPGYTARLPMYDPRQLLPRLLADTFPQLFADLSEPDLRAPGAPAIRWYACPADTAYRRMMHQSDNFFAEQLLLLCAGEKFDTLNPQQIQRWALDSLWTAAMPLRWADGSGLSRYNLLSPRLLSTVLRQLWRTQDRDRLFDLFPAGGEEGTLQGFFESPAGRPPYLYAKTGSMGGVFCLSGYLVARSGRVLTFSCMSNHFVGSNKAYKAAWSDLLLRVWDRF
jgi:D-alanyl-D-alanine carboxypeptidase/D-alanyl-D-alanine-endopeptidase (penicillin-binding protein 4)